jgi:hypothetical protein
MLIFGLGQCENEYFETLKVMQGFSRDMMKTEAMIQNTDYVSRFDTRCTRLLILVTLPILKSYRYLKIPETYQDLKLG